MNVQLKNHKTGKYITVSPSMVRNSKRPEFVAVRNTPPTLKYYANKANGEIELDEDGTPIYLEYSTASDDLLEKFTDTEKSGQQWINDSITALQKLTTPTAAEVDMLKVLKELDKQLEEVVDSRDGIALYNELANRYAYLNIPGFDPIDENFYDNGMKIHQKDGGGLERLVQHHPGAAQDGQAGWRHRRRQKQWWWFHVRLQLCDRLLDSQWWF